MLNDFRSALTGCLFLMWLDQQSNPSNHRADWQQDYVKRQEADDTCGEEGEDESQI